jgi:UDP-N-acetylmuramyl tripeptide synthase
MPLPQRLALCAPRPAASLLCFLAVAATVILGKRAMMGKVACKIADEVIITDDNHEAKTLPAFAAPF